MMGDIFFTIFFTTYVGLIVLCAIRVFLKIRKIIQKQQLKKSFKLIEGGKK